jgi:hypothetical protein
MGIINKKSEQEGKGDTGGAVAWRTNCGTINYG